MVQAVPSLHQEVLVVVEVLYQVDLVITGPPHTVEATKVDITAETITVPHQMVATIMEITFITNLTSKM